MNTVVLTISQKWQDQQLVRDALRKLHDVNPQCTIRFADPLMGTAKELREFAEVLEFPIERYRTNNGWFKYHGEIRASEMLTGTIRNPRAPMFVIEQRPRAELVMAFWCGTADNTKELIDRQLFNGDSVVVYREKWKKNRGLKTKTFERVERAENDKRKRTRLTEWRTIYEAQQEEAA